MKIIVERNVLLKTLGHMQSVVERRNTIPILANVLIRAGEEGVSLTATDMDLEMVERMAAEVVVPGFCTAPAHTLYEIVRKLADGSQVELHTADDAASQLTLTCGRSKFKLGCLPIADFPQMSEGDLQQHFVLSSAHFKTLIDRTRFAMSVEETRYYLNGIYLHTTKTKEDSPVLRAVATDGHRLARFEMPTPDSAAEISGVIIPRKTVQEIRKLLDETQAEVKISLSSNKIRIRFDGVVLTSKLIDGTFPDYERVIPKGNNKLLEVDTKAMANAVDRVATISSEKSRAVKMAIAPASLVLSASSADASSATEALEVAYSGEELDIGFNARYLMDILAQISGDRTRFSLADSGAPSIVQDIGDASALYVLMPMRV